MNSEKCSCRARDKAKCSKENGLGCGKMCLKEEDCPELSEISLEKSIEMSERFRKNIMDKYSNDNKAFDELGEKLWKEHPEEMAEAKVWAKDFIEKWKEDPGLVIVGDWFIDETVGVDWKTFIGDKDDHRNDH